MYVKFDVTEDTPAEITAIPTDTVWFGRTYVPAEDVKDGNPYAAFYAAHKDKSKWSIVHQGYLGKNHDAGYTIYWAHWLNEHGVGTIALTTGRLFILNDDGKTIDRV